MLIIHELSLSKYASHVSLFPPRQPSRAGLQTSLRAALSGSTNALQTTMLAVVTVSTVSELPTSLTPSRLSHTRVDAFRRRPRHGIRRRSLHRLLAVTTLDIGVIGLAARLVDRVGGEGLAGRSSAGWVRFSVEFLRVICRGGLDAGLVLFSSQFLAADS